MQAVNHIFPHWSIWLEFVYAVHGAALRLDATENTHPVQVSPLALTSTPACARPLVVACCLAGCGQCVGIGYREQ